MKKTNAQKHDGLAAQVARRRRIIDPEADQIERRMQQMGFSLTNTGGGCTAYERAWPYDGVNRLAKLGTMLVTAEDPTHPTRWDKPATISWWNAEGDMKRRRTFLTLRGVIAHIAIDDIHRGEACECGDPDCNQHKVQP